MKKRPLKILLIDDAPNVEEAIEQKLLAIGIECSIETHIPKRRNEAFGGCKLPKGNEFDKIDLALVDLELFPIEDFVELSPNDLRGGTEILPYLREEAPWLPVVAYSQHFAKIVNRFLPIACGFGFDGYLPRGLFYDKTLSQDDWNLICSRAHLLRKRAALGDQFDISRSRDVKIEMHPADKKLLDAQLLQWQKVIGDTFYFSDKVVLKRLSGGWSGAFVFQAYAKQDHSLGGKEGQWLLKISDSPTKLHRELTAHFRMMRSGVDYARMAQPLWPVVVCESGCAAIAFQFAHGTEEAVSILSKCATQCDDVMDRIGSVLMGFYGKPHLSRDIVMNLSARWGSSTEVIQKAADILESGGTEQLLRAIVQTKQEYGLGETIEFSQSVIHGDLHLGNIMLGERDILIDFSRSNPGPIAVDLARLAVDIVVRIPEVRGNDLPLLSGDHSSNIAKAIKKMSSSLKLTSGDELLYDVFLKVLLARHLTYADNRVSQETKAWITSKLKSVK